MKKMNRMVDTTWKFALLLLLGSLFFPHVARADAINFGFVFVAGLVILIPLTAFVVFVEGFILAWFLRVRFREVLIVALFANIVSLVAGIPVKIANSFIYQAISPKDLSEYFAFFPWMAAIGSVIYFATTIVTEYPAVLWWIRKKGYSFERRRLLYAVLIANITTYCVLAPLHYFVTKPTHNIKQFAKDSRWAEKPYTRIVYIDTKTKYLMSVDTSGSNISTLIPYEVKDYLLSQDMGRALYRGEQNGLFYYDLPAKQRTLLAQSKDRYFMNQVAISPSGNTIAFLKVVGEYHPHRLMVYQVPQHKLLETEYTTDKDTWEPSLAWSSREDTLYVNEGKVTKKVVLRTNGATDTNVVESLDDQISLDYGRNSTGHWWGSDDWGALFSHDMCGSREADAYSGLESSLIIYENKKRILTFADNPGLLHLGKRPVGDVAFLASCEECIFDDHSSIYLVNIPTRRIGKIVDGYRFMTISNKYSKRPLFMKEEK